MIRPATPQDTPALLRFLTRHEATSMFPIANLLGNGPATQMWVMESAGEISGYLGLTESGTLLPQAPDADWAFAPALLKGHEIAGLVGPPEQCSQLRTALGLDQTPTRIETVQPGFSLDLAALKLPDCNAFHITPLRDEDLRLITTWRAAALVETMGIPAADAPLEARTQVLNWQKANQHRVLWHNTTPVAIAGINAQTREAVQVGGVYTPPELRNQGHARRAVALLLAEAHRHGIRRALLFAASDIAARAYLAIGFRPNHSFGLTLFQNPVTLQ